ncbi:MAG: T9SS type A sorting domain-containing protein [Candidatus Eisenbacteria bacterium]|nr:T9SS type A sorting domain-containing protein [Candidatus Eisenbacteria bacterium]
MRERTHPIISRTALAICFAIPILFGAAGTAGAAVYFQVSPDTLVLGNDGWYEIGFRADDGGIAYLRDKTTGEDVSPGNAYGDLWRIQYAASGLVQSSSFSGGSSVLAFSYDWNPADTVLTFVYEKDLSGDRLEVTVTIRASEENRSDWDIHVENHTDDEVLKVYFPGQISFRQDDVERFYFPYYEGVAFNRSFFQEYRSTYQTYQHVFMDFGALQSVNGNWALYTLPDDDFRPANLGLSFSGWNGGVSVYHHMFYAYLQENGEWKGPTLRLRIGEGIEEVLEDVRTDRGWDATPDLETRAGDLYNGIRQGVLVKFDCQHVNDWGWAQPGETFAWVDSVAGRLSSNAIVHLVSFWPEGFDNNYPDYVPPNEDYGTEAEFLAIFDNSHNRKQLVMPYTNPTWWDDESPTFDSLGMEVTVRDLSGNPVYECYGANCGYIVSPAHQAVKDRVYMTAEEFTDVFPADLLFEDQVADRPWLYDTNPSETDYLSYTDHLIDNARRSARDIGLATEGMLDALMGSELLFFDSVLLDKKAGWVSAWGNDNWSVYPLTMRLAHDKMGFYQHNLAVEVMTHDKEKLTYNLAYGFGLNFDMTGQPGMIDNEWLEIDEVFQRTVAARCTGKRMTEFEYLDPGETVSRSVFEDVTVIGNHGTSSYDWGEHQIAPQGFYAFSDAGDLEAGVFTRWKGADLSGEHFLAVERFKANRVRMEHPSGGDGVFKEDRPANWVVSSQIHVIAVTEDGGWVDLSNDPSTVVRPSFIKFPFRSEEEGEPVREILLSYGGLPEHDPQTGVADSAPPKRLSLAAAPNPFNPETRVAYELPRRTTVRLTVHDVTGRSVRVLVAGRVEEAGRRIAVWDGRDNAGRPAASGAYFLRLRAGEETLTRKVVLVR